jgi:hypothetical protein
MAEKIDSGRARRLLKPKYMLAFSTRPAFLHLTRSLGRLNNQVSPANEYSGVWSPRGSFP